MFLDQILNNEKNIVIHIETMYYIYVLKKYLAYLWQMNLFNLFHVENKEK